MVNPATLAMTSMGASAGGSILSAFGSIASGKAQNQMYQYQAGVAQLNQQIALQNRDYAFAAGELEAGKYGLKAAAQRGAITAAQGASGVAIGVGSTADVAKSQADLTKIDLGTIRNNAARTAYGYSVEAVNQGAQADLYKMAGANAQEAGYINAFGSLLSGTSSVSSKWLQGTQSGIFGASNPVNVGSTTSFGE